MTSHPLQSIARVGLVVLLALAAFSPRTQAQGALLPSVSFAMPLTGETWPADFNGDGKQDLALSGNPIKIALGIGNGTFQTPINTALAGVVLTVGDVNHDNRVDIVAARGCCDGETTDRVVVLPGNGNGTVGAARLVVDEPGFGFASAADMNGDGHLDVVLGGGDSGFTLIVPGHGDLTFGTPVQLPFASGHVVAHLNADGLNDLVLAREYPSRLRIYLNTGVGLEFSESSIPTDNGPSDVAAADINGDGAIDLVASAREESGGFTTRPSYLRGFVYFLAGNGDGTFAAPRVFPSILGTHSVILGDFTRDGRLDVATTNRSSWYFDNSCGNSFQSVDSVSILPGDGAGNFGAPTSFAMSSQRNPDTASLGSIGTITAADLNGDTRPDLLASGGWLLMNAAPKANTPPLAFAGDDQFINENPALLRGAGDDPDRHYVTLSWNDGAPSTPTGRGSAAATCWYFDELGVHTMYLSVSDGHAVTSDTMTVTYQRLPSSTPEGGVTSPAVNEVVEAGTPYTIRWTAEPSAGATLTRFDVRVSINGEASTLVSGCSNLPGSARQCVWNSPGPLTENAVIFVDAFDSSGAQGGLNSGMFRIRPENGQNLPIEWALDDVGSVGAAGTASFAGGTFTVRGSGADVWGTRDEFAFVNQRLLENYEIIARVASVQNINEWTKVGVMMRNDLAPNSAHVSLFVTPTTAKGVAFQRRVTFGGTSVSTAGPSQTAPIWLRLARTGNIFSAYYRLTADSAWVFIGREQILNVPSVMYTGLVVSSHVDGTLAAANFDNVVIRPVPFPSITLISPVANQTVIAGHPLTITWDANDHPSIQQFTVYARVGESEPYQVLPGCGALGPQARSCIWQDPNPPSDFGQVFVVATQANGSTVSSAPVRTFLIVNDSGDPLPVGWSNGDVGSVGATGNASVTGTTFAVTGSGADIWGTADELHFARKQVTGDFVAVARVTSVQNLDQWTKAGLMVRASLSASSAHASVFATPTSVKGVAFQSRAANGGSSASQAGPAIAPPVWLRVVRSGNFISRAYRHAITDPWTVMPAIQIPGLPATVYVGLAVSSHRDGQLATATFDNVQIDPLHAFTPTNVGAVGIPGNADWDGTTYELDGSGADIWGTADQFMYLHKTWSGNGTIMVRVLGVENTNAWAKAGVMFRETTGAGSKQVMAVVSSGKGVATQYRPATGGVSQQAGVQPGVAPRWLRLTRAGDTFTSASSTDGTTWTTIGSTTVAMAASVEVGLAVTSHNNAMLSTAVFDDLTIRP